MRSGVIAQKLGMTRIFTEDGEQVPVTVLKVDNCQVVAQKTQREEWLHRRAARRRRAEDQAPDQGGARPFRRAEGRAEAQAPGVPRDPRER